VKRQEKADRIGAILDELYPEPPVPLDHADDFTLLVAVMLSAQTTDKKVNQITPKLFAEAPTPAKMAELEVDDIRRLIQEVGLAPTKAKNLRRTSELLMERHGGEVPNRLEDLEALPGVGHKTAQVVQAQAFDIAAFPVDTHIHRLAARWGLSKAKNVAQTERDLKKLFPAETWNARHLQIIYFGREYCPARGHDLTQCPICSWAASKKRIRMEELMARKTANKRKEAAKQRNTSRRVTNRAKKSA